MEKVSMQVAAFSALLLPPLSLGQALKFLPFLFFSFLFVVLEALAVCFLVVVFLET